MSSPHEEIASAIVKGQMAVMGDVAIAMAKRVSGVEISAAGDVTLNGDAAQLVNAIVGEYSSVTGPLGVRMCFNAARPALSRHADVTIDAFASVS
jgi:hypothetical protein